MRGGKPTCICGLCPLCRHRKYRQDHDARKRLGISLSPAERSQSRRIAAEVRHGKRPAALRIRPTIAVVESFDDGVSDEELDRRALAKWSPEWQSR